MKKKLKQLLALVLTLAVVMGFALPAAAADPGPRVTIEKVSNDAVTAEPEMHTAETKEDTPQYADTDMVRVSITLAGASTVDAGYASDLKRTCLTRAMPRAASRTMLRRTSTARV